MFTLPSKYAKKARQKAKSAKNKTSIPENSGSICRIKFDRKIMGHMEYDKVREEYVVVVVSKRSMFTNIELRYLSQKPAPKIQLVIEEHHINLLIICGKCTPIYNIPPGTLIW